MELVSWLPRLAVEHTLPSLVAVSGQEKNTIEDKTAQGTRLASHLLRNFFPCCAMFVYLFIFIFLWAKLCSSLQRENSYDNIFASVHNYCLQLFKVF